MTKKPKRGARVTYYRDRKGQWRWKLQAANYEPVSSGEGYATFSKAERGYRAMVTAIFNARQIVIED
jgi:uncharacterized protein YegP (UPF0339 family)